MIYKSVSQLWVDPCVSKSVDQPHNETKEFFLQTSPPHLQKNLKTVKNYMGVIPPKKELFIHVKTAHLPLMESQQ